jgi:hypothetical protein
MVVDAFFAPGTVQGLSNLPSHKSETTTVAGLGAAVSCALMVSPPLLKKVASSAVRLQRKSSWRGKMKQIPVRPWQVSV